MTWSDALPNFLIGLREGLEAGLVVSILLAALRRTSPDAESGRSVSTAPIWLGVTGAVAVAGSFAAVLTYSTDVLDSSGQEAVGGVLSVLAVGLVTAMVFWMRRTAASLSRELRSQVAVASRIGAGALAVTAFLSVGREGLETTLFLWTAVRATGQTASPLVGAGLGLAAAVLLCWLLFRQAVRLNLGVFFNRTAVLLIVIAAGVLAYGLGDLQDAGLLPGSHWVAFDLTAHIDPNSWWASIISGLTDLAPKMTVLQVTAWLVYLAVVVPLFLLAARTAPRKVSEEPREQSAPPSPASAPAPASTTPATPTSATPTPNRWLRLAGARPWPTAAVLVGVPAVAAATTVALLPSAAAGSTTTVTVTATACAHDWTAARSGTQTIAVDNKTSKAGEINLVNSSDAVVAEIETIGPATTADMTATLGHGTYTIRCLMSGHPATASAAVQVTGGSLSGGPTAVKPVTLAELTGPNTAYQHYAAAETAKLATAVAALQADLARGDLAAARTDWLTAQLDWELVGASYDSFGDEGTAVDGLPDGLPNGVTDAGFTGLHRLEYGLWHGQSAAQLKPVAAALTTEIATVQHKLTTDDEAGDPTNLPIRAHEILEDALRDHLSGVDDEGAGATYPMTLADVQVTRTVLDELAAPLDARAPALRATAERQLDALQTALLATRTPTGAWQPPQSTPQAAREQVDAAIGTLLETLDQVPDLLEVPPTH